MERITHKNQRITDRFAAGFQDGHVKTNGLRAGLRMVDCGKLTGDHSAPNVRKRLWPQHSVQAKLYDGEKKAGAATAPRRAHLWM